MSSFGEEMTLPLIMGNASHPAGSPHFVSSLVPPN